MVSSPAGICSLDEAVSLKVAKGSAGRDRKRQTSRVGLWTKLGGWQGRPATTDATNSTLEQLRLDVA
jgi:hypothetical protein